MARGFESKSIADQQESRSAPVPKVGASGEPTEPAQLARRRTLELSRADVKHRLAVAHAKAHRQILERALAALDAEIASLK